MTLYCYVELGQYDITIVRYLIRHFFKELQIQREMVNDRRVSLEEFFPFCRATWRLLGLQSGKRKTFERLGNGFRSAEAQHGRGRLPFSQIYLDCQCAANFGPAPFRFFAFVRVRPNNPKGNYFSFFYLWVIFFVLNIFTFN